jgi:O-antigen/teichoic acid export membrane protein
MPEISPISGTLLFLSLLAVPLSLSTMLMQNIMIGLGQIKSCNIIELVQKSIWVAALLLAVYFNKLTPASALALSLCANAFTLSNLFHIIKKQLRKPIQLSFQYIKLSFRYGLKGYIACFFAFLVLKFDMLMIQHILGEEPTGHYAVAVTLIDLIYMIPVVIGTVLFPKLTAIEDETRRLRVFAIALLATLAGVCVISLAAYALVDRFIVLLYGEAFFQSAVPFKILLLANSFMSACTLSMNYLASCGMPLITIFSYGLGFAINFYLNLRWIPTYGIAGAAWASVISYCTSLFATLLYICFRSIKTPPLPFYEGEHGK